MGTQEEGGARRPTEGRSAVPIPTAFASNEAPGARRLKAPTSRRKLRNINIPEDQKSDGAPTGNARAVQEAAYGSNKFVFLKKTRKGKKGRGIYHVKGRKKKNREVNLVHSMNKPVVHIPKTPWLIPARKKTLKGTFRMYRRNLIRQIDRARNSSR